MPTIAVDAMGGEHAPDEPVKAVAEVSLGTQIDCLLVGDERRIQAVLAQVPYNPEQISILHCRDAIGMSDDPHEAVKRNDASLIVGMQAVVDGRADALVSAGNTAACVVAAARHFRLIDGVRRAALASVHPRHVEHDEQDPLAMLLDVGATVRCEADELVQFALMGAAYAERVSKVPRPRLALLNMGNEAGMGGDTLATAYRRLQKIPHLNFVGNVLGNDLTAGRADVIVCEGLLGNVALRLLEGVAEVLHAVAEEAAERRLKWRVGLRLLSSGLTRVQELTDYRPYGGSPLLGFQHLLIKCQPGSRAGALANGVKIAAKAVRDGVTRQIADAIGGQA
jgi:glycerol-3-phosphate acyltransferase PlsX